MYSPADPDLPKRTVARTTVTVRWWLLLVLLLAWLVVPQAFLIALLSSLAPNLLAALLTKQPPFQFVFGVSAFGLAVMYQTSSYGAQSIHNALVAQMLAFFAVGLNELLFGERERQAVLGLLFSLLGAWIASWITLG